MSSGDPEIVLADGYPLHSARREEILEERAWKIADPEGKSEDEGESLLLLEFSLSYEQYAVEMKYVKEVNFLRELTEIPGIPEFIAGIMNYRSSILSVVNLKRFFSFPGEELTDFNRVIVLSDGDMEFGLLTDRIVGIRSMSRDVIDPPISGSSRIGSDFLLGIAKGPLIILDGKAVLQDKRMVVQYESR